MKHKKPKLKGLYEVKKCRKAIAEKAVHIAGPERK